MTERILIVDDHPLTRDALAGLLAQNGFDVVGQAGSGEEAIARAGGEARNWTVADEITLRGRNEPTLVYEPAPTADVSEPLHP